MTSLLVLLFLFQIKHMFADFFLQTPRMLSDRGRYVHAGRAQHAGVHALGSAVALLIVGAPVALVLPVIVAEWLAHYHIDWAKGRRRVLACDGGGSGAAPDDLSGDGLGLGGLGVRALAQRPRRLANL